MSLLDKYLAQGDRIRAANAARKEMAIATRELNKELEGVMRKLKQIPEKALSQKERRKALRKAARPLIASAQAKAPVMRGRRKVTVTLKSGERVTYYPGNLKLSIRELVFRKSPAIFVGPKVTKRRQSGAEYGKTRTKVDAYYAHFVEYGTRNMDSRPYMRPAYESTKRQVIKIATDEAEKLIADWARKNKVR